jgi:predicted aspartyl protease
MGVFDVTLQVANPATPNSASSLQLLVDTGATLSSMPRPFLQSIGVLPGMTRAFLLADGRRVYRETGSVLATIDGVTMPIPVMFADEHNPPVLGATALEILGFAVDPIAKKLLPRDLLALQSSFRAR